MNDKYSISRNKRQLTPKINHTKTTITKSTPFLIRKHHLDDTQMKNALHYDESYFKPTPPRKYSYKGEVITCQNSKLTTNIPTGNDHSNKIGASQIPEHDSVDYYGINNHKQIKNRSHLPQIQIQKQVPYFPNSGQRQNRVKTSQSRDEKERSYIDRIKQKQTQLQLGRQYQEYGLRQMHTARKKMQKQAKKLRELYKKKVEKDIKSIKKGEVTLLEQQIKQLKIENLQIQKQRQIYELNVKINSQTEKKVNVESDNQFLKYNKAKFLLSKPKYQPILRGGDDTDSSFSSFQLY